MRDRMSQLIASPVKEPWQVRGGRPRDWDMLGAPHSQELLVVLMDVWRARMGRRKGPGFYTGRLWKVEENVQFNGEESVQNPRQHRHWEVYV